MNLNIIAVPFHSQTLSAVLVNDLPFVAMKPICEAIGIDWEGQRQKIMRHPVLNQTACMIKAVAEDGNLREMLMLPIKYLNGWLFGIDANRVKPEAKDLVIEYQRECFDVLAEHFMSKPQHSLKQLPPSPYISEAEAAQFKKSIEAHCGGNRKHYGSLYRKIYDYYGITSYKNIPTGKLEEAARLCGMKLLKLVKSKIPEEIQLLTFTQEQLDALIAERLKAIEGEVMPNEVTNSITINLAPTDKPKRWLLTQSRSSVVTMSPIDDDQEVMSREGMIRKLRHDSNYIIFDKTGVSARQMVMHHIPPKFLPDMIEEAGAMLRRAGKLQA